MCIIYSVIGHVPICAADARTPELYNIFFLFPAAAGGSVSPKEGNPWRLSPRKSLTQLILLMNSLCIIFSLKGMGTCDSGPGQRDQRSADCYAQCREVTMLAPVAVTTRVAAQAGYTRWIGSCRASQFLSPSKGRCSFRITIGQ